MTDIDQMATACVQYKVVNNVFPATLATLTVANPQTGKPYLTSIPTADPWGTPYIYGNNTTDVTLRSVGPNKKNDGGTVDDVDIVKNF